MKKLLTLLAITASFAVLSPATSLAGDHHHSSRSYSHACGSCGSSVYRERVVAGYNRCGEALYSYRTVGHSCRPRSSHGHDGHSSGHGGSHHGGSHHGGNRGQINFPGFHLDLGGHEGHR